MFIYIDFENFENFASGMFIYIDFPRLFIRLLHLVDRCFGPLFIHKSIKNNGKCASDWRKGCGNFPGAPAAPQSTATTLFPSNYPKLIPGCSYI